MGGGGWLGSYFTVALHQRPEPIRLAGGLWDTGLYPLSWGVRAGWCALTVVSVLLDETRQTWRKKNMAAPHP